MPHGFYCEAFYYTLKYVRNYKTNDATGCSESEEQHPKDGSKGIKT